MDKPKAIKAAAHKLARLIYTMLTKGTEYVEKSPAIQAEKPPTGSGALVAVGLLACLLVGCATVSAPTSPSGSADAGVAAYERADYSTALTQFTAAANEGSGIAMFGLAMMYGGGCGVVLDDDAAVQ